MAITESLPENFARPRVGPGRAPRRGGILGLLLVLGGLMAAGYVAYDRLNRVEVVITNPSSMTIRRVQLWRGFDRVEVGPIGPNERRRASFRLRGEGPIEGTVFIKRPFSPDSGCNLKLVGPWQAGDRLALTYDGSSVAAERKARGQR